MSRDFNREMLSFIEKSPSCFHVIQNLRERLDGEGFEALDERGDWKARGGIRNGGKYYVSRNDSSLIAFQIPMVEPKGFHIVASHSDSPSFKIKEHPGMEVEGHYIRLNTEKYGGMILSTWLDRALSVAGRVAVKEGGRIVTKLVNIDKDLLVIPNLAIHMNHEINRGMEYNPQVDMLPLYACCGVLCSHDSSEGADVGCSEVDCADESAGIGKAGSESVGKSVSADSVRDLLLQEVAETVGVDAAEILGHDLFLYAREKGRVLGRDGAFVLSPRLDDLQCVFASMEAFLAGSPEEYISLCAVFDNEEVGSGTKQGADSTFLEDVIARVSEGLCSGKDEDVAQDGTARQGEISRQSSLTFMRRMIADSFLISADNAHAVHPNHPEKADPTNRPYLNGGIVIKYHGSQKYTTDALSAARMKDLCVRAGVPFQTYANRSDIAGGSTLGNISTAHVSVPSVDIGLPQLAMHSAVETAGSRDTEYAVRALRVFFEE